MTDPLRKLIQTQHPQLADEVKLAINTMQRVLNIAGANPFQENLAAPESNGDPTATAQYSSSVDLTATTDSSASIATDRRRLGAPETPSLSAGEAFGRYQIVNMLGKGAMGVVYLAYDPQLDRHVAIKIPFVGENPVALERFYIEARATATLRSPNICPVYDVGQINGVHFISMAFIDGRPLSDVIEEGIILPEKAADVVRKTARGIQKAHERGIIHRDIKPDNIMIDDDDEPVVMDFGLARRSDTDDARLTRDGSLLGSPAYMSPEQVEGKQALIGPASDIYSLGVVLYQMLTQRLPFEGGSILSVLKRIAKDPPPPPSTYVEDLKGTAIESICLKMMEKSPSDRYACAGDVADALEKSPTNGAKPEGGSLRRFLWPFKR